MPPQTHQTIRSARRAAGVSQRELARRLCLSPATISAIESGATGITVERLRAVAAALEVDARELLDGNEESARGPEPRGGAPRPVGELKWREFLPVAIDPILRAAIEAFVETGYHGATMRSLAHRAGTSVPGVYQRYRSKQDLLVRILDLIMNELHWRVKAARAEGDTGIARVGLVVEALALYHTHRRDLAFIGASEMRSLTGDNRRRITASRNALQYALDEEIAAAVADGHLHTEHPHIAGRAIVTMCTSLAQWFHIDGPYTPEQIAREYSDFALDLLRK
ncbi:helix-turn-helix domain-containing protein [Nocardia sp. SYP-A9097]|uniref:helix-turn-helix domain-containing protein n=1 Tax=Nocardia sp. SYP-A9097 TaxID=2663237 RepID=UPI00129BFD49|nr:helix-turn-helix domain-containing protein [Nocardia sp. SYP-A9097]MRH91771.1 helix-turn-helix domain-containing protein [Nocardia sp. SYP-A9097]